MRVNDAFPSKYLKAADLGGREREATITRVARERIGTDSRLVAYLAESPKALALNKTNATTIARAYGEETDDWPGRRIVLFVTDVEYRGERVPAIRVRTRTAPPAPPPRPAIEPASRDASSWSSTPTASASGQAEWGEEADDPVPF